MRARCAGHLDAGRPVWLKALRPSGRYPLRPDRRTGAGSEQIVSEDSVRRALCDMDPEASQQWMQQALKNSANEALDRSWILKCCQANRALSFPAMNGQVWRDNGIKSLYGHQEGAEIGYNPHKQGRPSDALHNYW